MCSFFAGMSTPRILVADFREATEGFMYCFYAENMPRHMKRIFESKTTFENVDFHSGADECDGIVDAEHEEAEERLEEISEYIESMCTRANKYVPSLGVAPTHFITLVAC